MKESITMYCPVCGEVFTTEIGRITIEPDPEGVMDDITPVEFYCSECKKVFRITM